jgi:hypothetical protein
VNLKTLAGCIFVVGMIAGNVAVLGDEATGIVADTGFGSFTMDEKGTIRQFNLSSANSQYEPGGWRPTPGDEITVTFTVVPGKRGGATLAVGKATLVKAGPSTVAVTSPIVVEIVEIGKSGVNAKVPAGQVVKFTYQRSTQKIPVGWVPVIGNKAKLDVHFDKGFGGFTVNYLIDKMEKVDAAD